MLYLNKSLNYYHGRESIIQGHVAINQHIIQNQWLKAINYPLHIYLFIYVFQMFVVHGE